MRVCASLRPFELDSTNQHAIAHFAKQHLEPPPLHAGGKKTKKNVIFCFFFRFFSIYAQWAFFFKKKQKKRTCKLPWAFPGRIQACLPAPKRSRARDRPRVPPSPRPRPRDASVPARRVARRFRFVCGTPFHHTIRTLSTAFPRTRLQQRRAHPTQCRGNVLAYRRPSI